VYKKWKYFPKENTNFFSGGKKIMNFPKNNYQKIKASWGESPGWGLYQNNGPLRQGLRRGPKFQ
jgi:hypothetical protein